LDDVIIGAREETFSLDGYVREVTEVAVAAVVAVVPPPLPSRQESTLEI